MLVFHIITLASESRHGGEEALWQKETILSSGLPVRAWNVFVGLGRMSGFAKKRRELSHYAHTSGEYLYCSCGDRASTSGSLRVSSHHQQSGEWRQRQFASSDPCHRHTSRSDLHGPFIRRWSGCALHA